MTHISSILLLRTGKICHEPNSGSISFYFTCVILSTSFLYCDALTSGELPTLEGSSLLGSPIPRDSKPLASEFAFQMQTNQSRENNPPQPHSLFNSHCPPALINPGSGTGQWGVGVGVGGEGGAPMLPRLLKLFR